MEIKNVTLSEKHTPFGAAVAYVVSVMQRDIDNLKNWGDHRNLVVGYAESLIATLVAAGEMVAGEEEAANNEEETNNYENEYE